MPTNAIRKYRAGDTVEVLTADEIRATLDDDGVLDGMPFMPEMLQFCGRRFRVSKRAHKTCDTVHQTGGRRLRDSVHLDDLRCDGSGHDGCKASCLIFWKTAWLRPVSEERSKAEPSPDAGSQDLAQLLASNTRTADSPGTSTVYRCQATAAYVATEPLPWWAPGQYVEDLTSGNQSIGQMLRVWLFHGLHKLMGFGVGYRLWRKIYDFLQIRVGGYRYPFRPGRVPEGEKTPVARLELAPGERVRIKSHDEILDTLDRGKSNRGMRFDEEMVPYCGKEFTVSKRVDRIIHETTGEMIEIKSPSVILDGVVCRSEVSQCRLFCPRAIPSYWREIWLERTGSLPNGEQSAQSSE